MTEATNTPATPAPADPTFVFKFEGLSDTTVNCAEIPAETRMDLLKGAAREYIRNRVNQAAVKYGKDENVVAWNAYDEAVKADPLQNVVPQPTTARPADGALGTILSEALTNALNALKSGDIKRKSGEPGAGKARKDPLIAMITKVVVKEVFEGRKATDPKTNYLTVSKDVGADGLAYLRARIDEKVAAGAERAPLEKMLETKYIGPCKIALGMVENKTISGLPSIL